MKNLRFKKTLCTLIISSSFIGLHAYAATNSSGATVQWTYSGNTGPSDWAKLNPDFALCGQGKAQSPINIPSATHNIPDLLDINYVSAPLIEMDNGLTTLMLGNTSTVINDGHGLQVNFPSSKETINLDGTVYNLVQFHLHTPSENTLSGHPFAGEIHFVHQGPNGKVAVIAVFIKVGKANPTLQEIINHLPKQEGQAVAVQSETINPANLIPARQNYYSFKGSLTTPPCTEGLEWLVMINPITASQAQIDALTAATGGHTARPIQPLNNRPVTASVQKI